MTTTKPTAGEAPARPADVLDQNLETLFRQAGDPATIAPAVNSRVAVMGCPVVTPGAYHSR